MLPRPSDVGASTGEARTPLQTKDNSPYTVFLLFAFLKLISSEAILNGPPGNTNTTDDPSFKYYLPESNDRGAVEPKHPIQFQKFFWFLGQEYEGVDFNVGQFHGMGGIRVMIQTSSRSLGPRASPVLNSVRLNAGGVRGSKLSRVVRRRYTLRAEIWMTRKEVFRNFDIFYFTSDGVMEETEFPYPLEVGFWLFWVVDSNKMVHHETWEDIVKLFRKASRLFQEDGDLFGTRSFVDENLGEVEVEVDVRRIMNNTYASVGVT
jgi:hypothetical protein